MSALGGNAIPFRSESEKAQADQPVSNKVISCSDWLGTWMIAVATFGVMVIGSSLHAIITEQLDAEAPINAEQNSKTLNRTAQIDE